MSRRAKKGYVGLYVLLRNGDYVVGATEDPMGDQENYWPDAEAGDEIAWAYVPKKLSLDLVRHGTSDQIFSDGYEAFTALEPYLETEED